MLVAMLLVLACGRDPVTPPTPTSATFLSSAWSYHYSYPGWTEWLDSVRGTIAFEVGPEDKFAAGTTADVIGFFRGHASAWPEDSTVAGAAVIWPNGLRVTARMVQLVGDPSSFTLADPHPTGTWLTPSFAAKFEQHGDTLYFASGIATADSVSFSLIVTSLRR